MTLVNIAKHGVGIADQTDGRCDCSQTTMKSTKSAKQKPDSIPKGLELVSSEDGTDYLVPEFMVPMAEHVRDVRDHRSALKVGLQDGGVSEIQTAIYFSLTYFIQSWNSINAYHERIALGNVMVPTDPVRKKCVFISAHFLFYCPLGSH